MTQIVFRVLLDVLMALVALVTPIWCANRRHRRGNISSQNIVLDSVSLQCTIRIVTAENGRGLRDVPIIPNGGGVMSPRTLRTRD